MTAHIVTHREHPDPFVRFPRELLENPALSFKAKGLLAWLLDKGEFPGGWETEVSRICSITSEGRDAVRATLAELELAGYLTRLGSAKGGRGQRMEWHVRDHSILSENPEVTGESEGIIHLDEAEKASSAPHYRETSSRETNNALFAAFWVHCLRKEAKRDAEKAFVRALKRADVAAIAGGQSRWNAYWTAERTPIRYMPLPASWLNGDRFNDQPPPTTAQKLTFEQQIAMADLRIAGGR